MRTIGQQTGWLRTLWGRDVNSSHKVDIFIGMQEKERRKEINTKSLVDPST